MIRMVYVVYVNGDNGNQVKMAGVEFNSYDSATAFTAEIRANNPELNPVAVKVMRRA